MDQGTSRILAEDIEAVLSEVADVKAARVVAAPNGTIAEIHILATPAKAPKQLVRDIESAIMARFGVPIDHRIVSIAQLGRDSLADKNDQEREAFARPRIVAVNASVRGVQASAAVTLEIEGREFVGHAGGPASQTGRSRFIALAALDALSQYTDESISFALEDVSIVQLGKERVAVACVCLVSSFGEQFFTGSALARQSDNDSIVRATLDAINRRMGFLKTA